MFKHYLTAGAVVALAVGFATPASALLQVAAQVNATTFSCFDNQVGCDENASLGIITLGPTNIGGVEFEGSSQVQTVGPPTNALFTNSQQITNNTGSTATITFVVGGTDFAAPTDTFSAAGSGTWLNAPGSTIDLAWYGDTANAQGASDVNDLPGAQLATGGPFVAGTGADSFDTGPLIGPWDTSAPYSWTMWASGDLVSGGTATLLGRSQDITSDIVAVPEPGSLALLGVGLLGAGWVARRRQRKNRSNLAAA